MAKHRAAIHVRGTQTSTQARVRRPGAPSFVTAGVVVASATAVVAGATIVPELTERDAHIVADLRASLSTADVDLLASSQAMALQPLDPAALAADPITGLINYFVDGLAPNPDVLGALANFFETGFAPKGDFLSILTAFVEDGFAFNGDPLATILNDFILSPTTTLALIAEFAAAVAIADIPLAVATALVIPITAIFAPDTIPVIVVNAATDTLNPLAIPEAVLGVALILSNSIFESGAQSIPSQIIDALYTLDPLDITYNIAHDITDIIFNAGSNSIPSGALQAFFKGFPFAAPTEFGPIGVLDFLADGIAHAIGFGSSMLAADTQLASQDAPQALAAGPAAKRTAGPADVPVGLLADDAGADADTGDDAEVDDDVAGDTTDMKVDTGTVDNAVDIDIEVQADTDTDLSGTPDATTTTKDGNKTSPKTAGTKPKTGSGAFGGWNPLKPIQDVVTSLTGAGAAPGGGDTSDAGADKAAA